MKSFHDGKVIMHAGDCMDVLRTMPADSIDAVVSDPPYHLTSIVKRFGDVNAKPTVDGVYNRSTRGFMGKQWDGGDIAFRPELWAEVLRVLKPGGHMVCFGGTRTYHRMTCAIEDAGFEIRDAIMWHYGSGFPKSHDVSKGIDRAAGAERETIGVAGKSGSSRSCMAGNFAGGDYLATAPATDAARQWQGYGTALKPSTEIICLARKPLSESTVAGNVLRWGTGALNIDATRVGTGAKKWETPRGGIWQTDVDAKAELIDNPLGRWPPNLAHDGSPEVLEGFPDLHGEGSARDAIRKADPHGIFPLPGDGNRFGDSGSAARFFYTAKAGKNDRITRFVESVRVEWISESGPCQASLLVDTEPSPERDIAVLGSTANHEWNTFLSGSNIVALCRMASKCIIETETNSTTTLQTWSWLMRLLTSAYIPVANYETVNGSSHAENVEKLRPSLTIILGESVFLPGVNHAVSHTPLRISVSGKQHSHPTVKPVDLMQWLVRLVCPKGATVLDPFAGTGTTGAAAFIEGCKAILIEREAEYLADIERRMGMLLSGQDERARKLATPAPHDTLPLFAVTP